MCFAKTITTQIEEFKQQIMNDINAIPQNPKIRKLNEKTYGISLKDSADNWSIFYYNNKLQAKAIASLIAQESDIDAMKSLLKIISEKGYYQTSAGNKLHFNHQVRNHIDKIVTYKF